MRTQALVTRMPGHVPQWSFADRLRKARREFTSYTQEEMANALEVGLKAYSAWEAGKNPPSDIISMSTKLERITGIPRQWFIGWMEDPEPTPPSGPGKDSEKITIRLFGRNNVKSPMMGTVDRIAA